MTIAEQVLADRASISEQGVLARIMAKHAEPRATEPRSTPPPRVERAALRVGKKVEGRKCECCREQEAVANCEDLVHAGRTADLCWDCIDDTNRLFGPKYPGATSCEACQESPAVARVTHRAYPGYVFELCQPCADAAQAVARGEPIEDPAPQASRQKQLSPPPRVERRILTDRYPTYSR